MKRLVRRYWRYAVGLLALGLLVRWVGAMDLAQVLRGTRPGPLVVYLLGAALVPALLGAQLWVGLRLAGLRAPLGTVVAGTMSAWSVGTLTPARAGDLSLAFFLSARVREAETLALVVLDKLVSLGVLALLAWVSALWIRSPHAGLVGTVMLPLLGTIVVALTAIALARSPARIGDLVARVIGRVPLDAYAALRSFVRKPQVVLWFCTATLARWLYLCAVNLLIFKALAQDPGYGHVVAGTAVGRVVSAIPVSVGGMGLKEPVQIPIYADAGVPAEAVVAVSILGMACTLLTAAVIPALFGAGTEAKVPAESDVA